MNVGAGDRRAGRGAGAVGVPGTASSRVHRDAAGVEACPAIIVNLRIRRLRADVSYGGPPEAAVLTSALAAQILACRRRAHGCVPGGRDGRGRAGEPGVLTRSRCEPRSPARGRRGQAWPAVALAVELRRRQGGPAMPSGERAVTSTGIISARRSSSSVTRASDVEPCGGSTAAVAVRGRGRRCRRRRGPIGKPRGGRGEGGVGCGEPPLGSRTTRSSNGKCGNGKGFFGGAAGSLHVP